MHRDPFAEGRELLGVAFRLERDEHADPPEAGR